MAEVKKSSLYRLKPFIDRLPAIKKPDGHVPFKTKMYWTIGILVMYFVLMRPQKKREQERKEMLARLNKGDRVVTMGGIHGEIVRLSDKEATLLVDKKKGVEIRVLRSAVSGIAGPKGGEGEGGTQASK